MSRTAEFDGAAAIIDSLQRCGVTTVFGVPGSQNVRLFESLRQSPLRVVVATDEMAAAFMAGAYARTTGGLGVLTTIPGPGFTFALSGLAEARADSAGLLYVALTVNQSSRPFTLQLLDQKQIVRALVKGVIDVASPADLAASIHQGAALALSGEPGPVVVELPSEFLVANAGPRPLVDPGRPASPTNLEPLAAQLGSAQKPLFFLGQGAREAGPAILEYAAKRTIPISTTCSGRGIAPEDHELVHYRDFSFGTGTALPDLIRAADLVVAVGCKLSHNGTSSFELPFSATKFIHVDASADVLATSYPMGDTVHARASEVGLLLADLITQAQPSSWNRAELAERRAAIVKERVTAIPFVPPVAGSSTSLPELFAAVDLVVPRNRIIVTDSGLHQGLVRSLATVCRPGGLLAPADFQSMGFGIPAAIAAKVADPTAVVVACIGDGGFAMMGGELLTAVREGLDLIVVVFNNGSLGLIEQSQLSRFGHRSGTKLNNPDFALFAEAVGANYHYGNGGFGQALRVAVQTGGVHVIELEFGISPRLQAARAKAIAKRAIKAAFGDQTRAVVKRIFGRGPA